MRNKNSIAGLIVWLIVFGVYNLLIFMLVETRTNVFWLSYGFSVFAFVFAASSIYKAFKNPGAKVVFLGIPLASLSSFYLGAELFASAMFIIFQGVGVKPALIVQVLLLAVFAIITIVAIRSRDYVETISDNVAGSVFAIRSLQADIELVANRSPDPVLKKKATDLAEAIRYSDPMSSGTVAAIEAKIQSKTTELGQKNGAGDVASAVSLVDELSDLIVERNKKILISKRQ
jgi:hypothetical protein